MLFACSTEADRDSPMWGIDFSDASTAEFAMGSVDKQVANTKVTYIAKSGTLTPVGENLYKLAFAFESGDKLEITITKKVQSYNYTFPGVESENQIVSALLNGEVLSLKESTLSIQPRSEENKLLTITTLHTLNAGDLNGTVGRVPLVK